MNKKIKHLEMIQTVITRMGNNLFILKGWTTTLIVALLSVAASNPNDIYILFAFFAVLIFWTLDGYFLSLERCYRALYDEVRNKKEKDINFSMNFKPFMKDRNTWIKSMFSGTLSIFYGALLLAVIVVTMISKLNNVEIKLNINWENDNYRYKPESVDYPRKIIKNGKKNIL